MVDETMRITRIGCLAGSLLGWCAAAAPAQELLVNCTLAQPGTPGDVATGWTLIEGPGQANSATFAPFANHTTGPTGIGLWLRPFEGINLGNGNVMTNAQLTQTVPATPGLTFNFRAWSRWEGGYSGGVTTLHPQSPSGAAPSPTETFLRIQFLDATNSTISSAQLNLRTVQFNDAVWRQHLLSATAPAGAVSVRVAALALNMIPNVNMQPGGQSVYFDDFSLTIDAPKLPGDFDLDGDVDLADYLKMSGYLHTDVSSLRAAEAYLRGDMTRDRKIDGHDFRSFRRAFDAANGIGAFAAATRTVPEASTLLLALCALGVYASRRRGR